MSETEKSAPAAAPTSAPAPASAIAGKNNSTKLIVIIVIVLIVLGAIGYATQQYFARKVAENIVEKSLESATGGKVDINSSDGGVTVSNDSGTTSTGSNAKWPTSMPSDVPEFKSGTIAYSSASTSDDYKGWNVTYSDVTVANATAYFTTLTGKGWAQTDSVESSLMTNKTFEKGTLRLNFTLDPSSNGATIVVSYKE
jgi:hypothetical protein